MAFTEVVFGNLLMIDSLIALIASTSSVEDELRPVSSDMACDCPTGSVAALPKSPSFFLGLMAPSDEDKATASLTSCNLSLPRRAPRFLLFKEAFSAAIFSLMYHVSMGRSLLGRSILPSDIILWTLAALGLVHSMVAFRCASGHSLSRISPVSML